LWSINIDKRMSIVGSRQRQGATRPRHQRSLGPLDTNLP
jgi:hypothetical protein